VYGELSFYNKLFDERDWTCKPRLVCTDVISGKQICDTIKELEVKKEQNIVSVREGWGMPNTGWWKKGKYKWDAYLDDTYLGTAYFYVVDEGLVTAGNNPYIAIKNVRLFESGVKGSPLKDRKYLKTFNKATARYINTEIQIEVLSNTRPLPLDFKFNYYNDAGQHKAFVEFFKEINGPQTTYTFDTGYGSNKGNYWYEDNYNIEIQFMNELIAVVPMKVGIEEELMENDRLFEVDRSHKIKVPVDETAQKPTYEEATQELNALIGLEAVKKTN
jgi:hypothetical protein